MLENTGKETKIQTIEKLNTIPRKSKQHKHSKQKLA